MRLKLKTINQAQRLRGVERGRGWCARASQGVAGSKIGRRINERRGGERTKERKRERETARSVAVRIKSGRQGVEAVGGQVEYEYPHR